jgi:HD-like signal output (HDOD) protein
MSTEPTHEKLTDVSQLTPLKNLPPRVLAYIAEQIEVEHYNPGKQIPVNGNPIHQVQMLLKGEVELTGPDGAKQIIASHADGALEPLCYAPDTGAIKALKPVSILRCPQDLYDNLRKLPALEQQQQNLSVTRVESEIRDTDIFWKFYDSFKGGKLKLPSQPGIAMRIAKVVNDPSTDSHDIARVIQADPTVAGRIISVVNSAAYRGRTTIDNLPDAVTRLGRNVTHNLVISFALSGLFDTRSHTLNEFMSAAWKHASYVAAICHELGRVTPGLSADNALLCGLVHDIGILPIINVARTQPELMENPRQLNLIINRLKGEIGAIVLREWGFPAGFIQAASHAEDWMQDINDKPNYVDLVILAQLHAFIGTKRMQQLPRLDLVPAFHKLALGKLTPRFSLHILENAKQNIQELQALLSGK